MLSEKKLNTKDSIPYDSVYTNLKSEVRIVVTLRMRDGGNWQGAQEGLVGSYMIFYISN